MELVSVAAVSDNLVIGDNGAIPWESLPEDRRQYRARVAEHPVILGRRTFDSMRADLPGRAQIVLSRTERAFDVETAHHAADPEAAIARAESLGAQTAYVLGGGAIYELFQPHLDRMVLSHVPGQYEGDTYYPEWDDDAWEVTTEQAYDGFRLREWARR